MTESGPDEDDCIRVYVLQTPDMRACLTVGVDYFRNATARGLAGIPNRRGYAARLKQSNHRRRRSRRTNRAINYRKPSVTVHGRKRIIGTVGRWANVDKTISETRYAYYSNVPGHRILNGTRTLNVRNCIDQMTGKHKRRGVFVEETRYVIVVVVVVVATAKSAIRA